MKYILLLSTIAFTLRASSQIVAQTTNNYDSSIVIKTGEYWDDIMKQCVTSTFIMQSGGMQELSSDGTMFGQGLLDSSASFNLGPYEYKIWSSEEGVVFMLIKNKELNKYIFKRLFSQTEETFKVVSVESKIDKVYKIGLGVR